MQRPLQTLGPTPDPTRSPTRRWRQSLRNLLELTVKELRAIRRDRVMVVLIVYVFTVMTYIASDAISTDVANLPVAVVDEDHSQLAARLEGAIRAPMFREPALLTPGEAETALSRGEDILVLTIPPDFEHDLRAGNKVTLNLDVDATAVAQAGNGAAFMGQLLSQEITKFVSPRDGDESPVDIVYSSRFNPNLSSKWFSSVMQLMNSVTILTLILSGASLIREREHGTIEHVLVMPVQPYEIVLSKILATGVVILIAAIVSLNLVVQWALGVPVAGSLILFACGTAIYVVAAASFGLLLATFTKNMGQFGLLAIPAIVVLILLSGGMTPLEAMPSWLQWLLKTVSPATHFVAFTQSVLYRGAGFTLVWDQMAAMVAMAVAAFAITLARFRTILAG